MVQINENNAADNPYKNLSPQERDNKMIAAINGFNHFINAKLPVPIWLEREVQNLMQNEQMGDEGFFGFTNQESSIRQNVEKYRAAASSRVSMPPLSKNHFIFSPHQVSFGDILNHPKNPNWANQGKANPDLNHFVVQHNHFLVNCDAKDHQKIFDYYCDLSKAYQNINPRIGAYFMYLAGDLCESRGDEGSKEMAAQCYQYAARNGSHAAELRLQSFEITNAPPQYDTPPAYDGSASTERLPGYFEATRDEPSTSPRLSGLSRVGSQQIGSIPHP